MSFQSGVIAATALAVLALGGSVGCQGFATRGYSGPEGQAGAGNFDTTVSAEVKQALSEAPVFKFPNVNVSTQDGVVQLSGFVQTEDQKQEAELIARQTPGVRNVINHITVRQPGYEAPGQSEAAGRPGQQPPGTAPQQ